MLVSVFKRSFIYIFNTCSYSACIINILYVNNYKICNLFFITVLSSIRVMFQIGNLNKTYKKVILKVLTYNLLNHAWNYHNDPRVVDLFKHNFILFLLLTVFWFPYHDICYILLAKWAYCYWNYIRNVKFKCICFIFSERALMNTCSREPPNTKSREHILFDQNNLLYIYIYICTYIYIYVYICMYIRIFLPRQLKILKIHYETRAS